MSVTVVDKIVGNLIECAHGDGVSTAFMPDIIAPLPTASTTYYRTDWQGTYALSPSARTNKILQSNNFGTTWTGQTGGSGSLPALTTSFTTGPDGIAAYRCVLDGGAGGAANYSIFVQSVGGLTNGDTITASIWLKSNTGSNYSVALYDGNAVTFTLCNVTPEWRRFSFTRSVIASSFIFRLATGTALAGVGNFADISISDAQLEIAPSPTPYIPTAASPVTVTDYTISSGLVTLAPTTNPVIGQNIGTGTGSIASFVIQTPNASSPTVSAVWTVSWQGKQLMYSTARTNLCPQSQTLNTGWGTLISGTAVLPITTGDYSVAPDGTMTADRVQFNKGVGATAGDYALIATPLMSGLVVSNPYRVSFWVKSNTSNTTLYGNGSSAGAIGSSGVSVTTSWNRVSLDLTASAVSGVIALGLRGTTGTPDTADVSLWGFQVEAGSVTTPYIPTVASSVTVTDYSLGARTNLVLFSGNQSNGNWGTVNAGVSGPVSDPYGGNSAYTLTSTLANGYLYQNVTVPNVVHTGSIWVRRRTGSGAVKILRPDGGLDVIQVDTSWKRFSASTLPVSGTTAQLGVSFATSGDAVDVAFGQTEVGAVVTPYIPTVASPVTVNDVPTFATNPAAGVEVQADYTYTGGLGRGVPLSRKLFNEYGIVL